MKKLNMKAIVFLISFLVPLYVFSHKKEKIQKEFYRLINVNPNSQLNINNYNGDLNFEVWFKNEIEIKVIIEVTTPKINKINKYIEAISVLESNDSTNINFRTTIDKTKLDASFHNGRSEFKVTYYVKHPVYLNLNLNNTNGNIYIDELSGNLNINLKNGTIYINKLTTDETKKIPFISLIHSKAVIKKSEFIEANLFYSKIIIDNTKSVKIVSEKSNVEIKNAYLASLKCNYDIVSINEVNKLDLKSKYSKTNIFKIYEYANFIGEYDDITVTNLVSNFTEATFDLSFANLDLGLTNDVCTKIVSNVKYSNIDLPKRANVDNYITLRDKRTTGTIGCISNAYSNLSINAEFSNINIHF